MKRYKQILAAGAAAFFLLSPAASALAGVPDTVVRIGRNRGCVVAGGTVDMEKTYKLIIKEYREGRIGAISLDWPGEFEGKDND